MALQEEFQSAVRLHQAGNLDRAAQIYRHILQQQPAHADALHLLGVIACQRNNFQDAVPLIEQAISVSPNVSAYHNSLGNALRVTGRLSDAIPEYRIACGLDQNNLQALNNLALALDDDNCIGEALECFDRLIAANGNIPEWHTNRGSTQMNARRVDAGIASFRRALALRPDFFTAHAKLGAALLLSGAFAEGWFHSEWRFKIGLMNDPTLGSSKPKWDGSSLGNRTLLIHAEQGFGDTIQFVRYARLIARTTGKVIVRCEATLARLLTNVEGVDEVTGIDTPLPPHDLQIAMLSLPMVFKTEESTIPRHFPYIRSGTVQKSNSTFRVGLVWAGNPVHGNDSRRSCPADRFNILAGVSGVEWVRLQLPAETAAPSQLEMTNHVAELKDFADTAELISKLDLVISVDTAVVHLAGAMGKPVWLLLAFAGEWRWLIDRSDSPWYPSARLFRQTSPGDWDELLIRVSKELETMKTRC